MSDIQTIGRAYVNVWEYCSDPHSPVCDWLYATTRSSEAMEQEDQPTAFKSTVWESFRELVVDLARTMCWHCSTVVHEWKHLTHIIQHHPDMSITGAGKKIVQQLLPTVIKLPLLSMYKQQGITKATGFYICHIYNYSHKLCIRIWFMRVRK